MPLFHTVIPFVASLMIGATATSATNASAGSDPLAGHRGKERILLVLTPDMASPQLVRQREMFDGMAAAARDRDLILVVVEAGTPAGTRLSQQYGLSAGFHAVLIGKDGEAKLTDDHPLPPQALLPLIDSMPMRQQELRQRS